ncbi:RNA polymerase sigma-70 factor (family 1) [Pedobacter africanus]|uniref:RNA polymerase sigma-70 factor (ECF subfamily) n=1 Tax=Pedobacter africanus TaxID=151894 RepID=A0ACC6L2M3_9SPHI|nr:RNA polymerase sigma-70 factor [Pedobacter africanus]MDR6785660.1 RNA polymerase sigma-70 factor (ECF subfamily) [Pedobacter africanus]
MGQLSVMGDDELLEAFQSGDQKAYQLIYDRYWQLLYRHARNMLRNDEEAKDVVQEVFTTLWLKKTDVKPPVAAFLYAASRNKILNQLKHLKIEARYVEQHKAVMEYPSAILPDEQVIERDFAKLIEAGIQSLPPKMRRIFELSRKEFKTHQEISEELQISSLTVKRQVSNAISILKNKLQSFLMFF